MKHLFIINPAAGKGNNVNRLLNEITSLMDAEGLEYECVLTSGPMHACEIARRAAEIGEHLHIYACGGDGTLNEVVNGAAGFSHVAVTQYPCGSGNDFLKIFGEDTSRFLDFKALLDYETSAIDLIDCNGRLAVNICSVGLDARIGLDMFKYKRLPFVSGKAAYFISSTVNTIKGVHLPYRIHLPGRDFSDRYTLVVFANGRYYGGSFNPTPDAEPDDGLMDVLVVNKVSRITVAKLIGRFAAGRYKEFPHVMTLYRHDRCTVFVDRPTGINVDGELVTCDGMAIFKISDKKVNIFYPKGLQYKKNAEIPKKIEV